MVLTIISVAYFLLALVFIFLEISKTRKKLKPKISFGNAQYIGEAEYQNDYFSVTEINNTEYLVTIFDGVSLKRNIRQGAILASNIINNSYIKNNMNQQFEDIIYNAFRQIEENNKRFVFENRIGISILSIQIKNDMLSYGNIGTCSLLLYRNGRITHEVNEQAYEEKYGNFTLKQNDKIVLLTKGAFSSITEIEIINELEKEKTTNDKAISLINKIRNKKNIYQENATIVLVEIN